MKIHLVAIGGAIMHNLAICLHNKGHAVSGSDDVIFDPAKSNLQNAGLLPNQIGFHEDNLDPDTEVVILGMHAKEDNPELRKALKLGIRVVSFPEFIYEESKEKTRVVVAGSHGKTSTTAMIMHVLLKERIDFDYLVGASLEGFERSVALSDAPIIILEGDEYLSSALEPRSKFLFYKPHISVITGIAWDHVNVFPTWESYVSTFEAFVNGMPEESKIIYFEEDDTLRAICKNAKAKVSAYGTPNHSINDGISEIEHRGVAYPLQIFGKHNLQNMEAAARVCEALGIDRIAFLRHIQDFRGAARRLERIDTKSDRIAFNDFAHSPSKLKASLNAVKEQFTMRKVIAVMELHTYSSTDPSFLEEFAGTMDKADSAIVYMSDHAFSIKRKKKIADKDVVEAFQRNDLKIVRKPHELKALLTGLLLSDEVVLLMSSGNFDGLDFHDFL